MREFVCLLSARSFLEGKGNTTLHPSLAIVGPDPAWTPFAVAGIPQPSDPHCRWPLRQWWGTPLWARLLRVPVGKITPLGTRLWRHVQLLLSRGSWGQSWALTALLGSTWAPHTHPGDISAQPEGLVLPWALLWGGDLYFEGCHGAGLLIVVMMDPITNPRALYCVSVPLVRLFPPFEWGMCMARYRQGLVLYTWTLLRLLGAVLSCPCGVGIKVLWPLWSKPAG